MNNLFSLDPRKKYMAFTLLAFAMATACVNTYQAYHGKTVPGRLSVVSIPGSCYYYVKDKLTGLCWLSCFDQSMLADERCKAYDKAFATRELDEEEGSSNEALPGGAQPEKQSRPEAPRGGDSLVPSPVDGGSKKSESIENKKFFEFRVEPLLPNKKAPSKKSAPKVLKPGL